jgi:hypothetical protein
VFATCAMSGWSSEFSVMRAHQFWPSPLASRATISEPRMIAP